MSNGKIAVRFSNCMGNFILMTSALKILRDVHDKIDLITDDFVLDRYLAVKAMAEEFFDDILIKDPPEGIYKKVYTAVWSRPSWLFKFSYDWHTGIPEVQIYLDMIEKSKEDFEGFLVKVAEKPLLDGDHPRIVLTNSSISGGSRMGRIAAWDKFPQLSEALIDLGFDVILVGQGSVLDGCKGQNFVDKLDIFETAKVISQCDLMVCADNGLMHIADALKVPILLLAGPTLVTKSGPVLSDYKVVRKFISCAPCFQTGLWNLCKDSQCMKMIEVDDVLSKIFSFHLRDAFYELPQFKIKEQRVDDWKCKKKETSFLVSIVILCRDSLVYTKKCLESIRKFTLGDYQLVLIDNNSTDGTLKYLESMVSEKDVLVSNFKNIGFPSGNNQGVSLASGKFICLLNNDCEVKKGWLDALIEKCKKNTLVGVLERVLNANLKKGVFDFTKTSSKDWSYLEGWCLFLRRDDFLSVGGFDTRFDPYLSEDADLSFSLKFKGFKLKTISSSFIYHHGSKSLKYERGSFVKQVTNLNNKKLYMKWIGAKKNSILIKRKGARGDVLLTVPILRALKEKYPHTKLIYATDCPEMLRNKYVDEIIPFEDAKLKEGSSYVNDVFDLQYERSGHTNYINDMAACALIEVRDKFLEFDVSKEELFWAKEYIEDFKGRNVAFHTGESWKSRLWEKEKFYEVAVSLKDKGINIFEFGNDATSYMKVGADCRQFSIERSMAVLAEMDLVVGIDSLVIHMAAAMKVPVIDIYGCTLPEVVWSEGKHYPVYVKGLECAGCRHKKGGTFVDCLTKEYTCLKEITTDMVSNKIQQAIDENW